MRALYSTFIATAISLAVSSPIYAAVVVVVGHGTISCGNVINDYQQQNDLGNRTTSAWVNGYLSAVNEGTANGDNIAGGTDAAARALWIRNYCTQHPLDTLWHATKALSRELQRR